MKTREENNICFKFRVKVFCSVESRTQNVGNIEQSPEELEEDQPVNGDIFYQLFGGTVVKDDPSWGDR